MSQQEEAQQTQLRESAPVPAMQKVLSGEVEKGAPVPRLQPVPDSTPPAVPANQGGEGEQGGVTTSQSSRGPGNAPTEGNPK
jgi:hypothetical protein